MKTIKQFTKERLDIDKQLAFYQTKIIDLKRKVFQCIDCNNHTGNYMVKDSVWQKAMPKYTEFKRSAPIDLNHVDLCLGCFEKRLGRKLVRKDFSKVPVNEPLLHMMSKA